MVDVFYMTNESKTLTCKLSYYEGSNGGSSWWYVYREPDDGEGYSFVSMSQAIDFVLELFKKMEGDDA